MTFNFERPLGRMVTFGLSIFAFVAIVGTPMDVAAQSATNATTTGSGTYVCTPAGFGSKSRCYRR